jgi:hypothetical protein
MAISAGISRPPATLPPAKTPSVAPMPLASSTHGTACEVRPVTSSSRGVM